MHRSSPPFTAAVMPTGLGSALRQARRGAGITQAALAARAGIDRPTLIALEQGTPGVAVGAYLAAVAALDGAHPVPPTDVRLDDYPQLQRLAWSRTTAWVSEPEALALYERNWHLVDEEAMTPHERGLLQILVARHGGGILHV